MPLHCAVQYSTVQYSAASMFYNGRLVVRGGGVMPAQDTTASHIADSGDAGTARCTLSVSSVLSC